MRFRQLDGSEEDPMINKKYKLPDDQLIKLSPDMVYGPMETLFDGDESEDVKSITRMINDTL